MDYRSLSFLQATLNGLRGEISCLQTQINEHTSAVQTSSIAWRSVISARQESDFWQQMISMVVRTLVSAGKLFLPSARLVFVRVTNRCQSANSAFHPSRVGKWVATHAIGCFFATAEHMVRGVACRPRDWALQPVIGWSMFTAGQGMGDERPPSTLWLWHSGCVKSYNRFTRYVLWNSETTLQNKAIAHLVSCKKQLNQGSLSYLGLLC